MTRSSGVLTLKNGSREPEACEIEPQPPDRISQITIFRIPLCNARRRSPQAIRARDQRWDDASISTFHDRSLMREPLEPDFPGFLHGPSDKISGKEWCIDRDRSDPMKLVLPSIFKRSKHFASGPRYPVSESAIHGAQTNQNARHHR